MDRLGTIALCGLLVLAGCSAVPGGSGGERASTGTLTPAPVPRTPTPVEQLAPGLTGAGVTDPLALATAHGTALGRNYRFVSNWTARSPNGTLYARARQRAVVAGATFRVWITAVGRPGFVTTGPRVDARFWSNGTVLAERVVRDGRVSYRYLGPERYDGGTGFYGSLRRPKPWRDRYALFTAVATRVVGRDTGGPGPARYTVVGTRLRDPATFAAATNVRAPANVSLRAVVDERGVVRSLRLSYTGRLPTGERVTVTRHVRYTTLGTVETVPRPEWFDAARNGSRTSRGSVPNPRLAGGAPW